MLVCTEMAETANVEFHIQKCNTLSESQQGVCLLVLTNFAKINREYLI